MEAHEPQLQSSSACALWMLLRLKNMTPNVQLRIRVHHELEMELQWAEEHEVFERIQKYSLRQKELCRACPPERAGGASRSGSKLERVSMFDRTGSRAPHIHATLAKL